MNFNSNFSNPSFKGKREDLKNLKSLSENNMPILPNKRQLILSAIDNVGKTGEKDDIEMLMGTVETMKYGIQNNSEFAKALGGANGEKENTDWDGILQSTIRNAIDSSSIEDKSELEARFQKIFGEEQPLTEEQKTMLDLRQQILSSKEMTDVLSDPEKTLEAARVTQNLDYFIASSEINNEDKVKCLGMMNHFLSDEYEIHPQLKDHKVQAFSEMVNDLIIKRPDEEVYTIKDVSQEQTGMCAAISIARKTVAYEDKVRAMEIMMAELDNKPTMEVYDRTAIGTGKKVEIQKAHVDFTDAMQKGYRIIDAGTHQWMNAANVVGDGSISIAHYQAFDPENYEIFRDAKWLGDLPQEQRPAQNWLRYLNKEEEAVGKAMKRNSDIVKVQKEIGEFKKDYETDIQKSEAAIRDIITGLDSSITDSKAASLTRQIIKADKLENPEFKLAKGEPKASKMHKLSAFLQSELPNVPEEAINVEIERINGFRDMSVNANEALDKLTAHSTPKAVFAYNKNLFSAAAHHRRSVQAELNVPERLSAYEKALNVPVRDGLLQEASQKILNNLSSEAVIGKTAENFGVEADADAVKLAVTNAVMASEVTIPAKMDEVLAQMGMGDRVSVVNSFLDDAANKIIAGDKETLSAFAENAHVKPNAKVVLKKIDAVRASLADNPSNKQISEAVNFLGYNNQIEMTADMYKTFADAVDGGLISKDQLSSLLGSNAEDKLSSLGKEIKSAADKQAQIERQLGLPTRQDVVLGVLEATGEVLPEKTLQEMQAKFDKVAGIQAENDNRIVDPGVNKPKVPDSVYKFTAEEKQLYSQIEAKLPQMKNYAKVNAKAMNKALAPQLDALFAEAGRLDGHLWVAGEGESGLYDNQSIKVLEMITGRHYYNEEDIDKVVAHIKQGNGSGTSSTNVDCDSYSGHAQYVCEVSQVEVIDPQTKESVMKDVLWHDNTWGRAEDKNTWVDEKGVARTNYGKEHRGGPDGYVFNTHLFNGTFVEDQKYVPGVLKDSGDKFDLWKATRIAGENPEAAEKLDKVMTSILQLGSSEQKVQEYEQQLRSLPPVDFALMDNAEAMMGKVGDKYIAKIEKGNIQTQADIDGLKDKGLKFLLEKTAVQMSVPSEALKKSIGNILDQESLAEIKSQLPEVQKQTIAAAFLKGSNAPRQVIIASQDKIIDAVNDTFAGKKEPENISSVISEIITTMPTDKLDGSLENLKQVMVEHSNAKIKEGIADKADAKALSKNIAEVISNAIDENTIKTAEDLKANHPDIADIIIKYADKKFDTVSDADLDKALQSIQNMTTDEFNAFMADASNADLGLKDVDAADVARQINAQKSIATEQFQYNARIQTMLSMVPQSDDAPEWLYRGLKMELTPLTNTIQISNYKKQGFMDKNGIRSAFPETKIMSDEMVRDNVSETMEIVKDYVSEISTSANKGEKAAEMNSVIRGYLSANIAEKYQSKAAGLINSYVKALRNNSADADKILNNAIDVMEQGHITKHPEELVRSFIKEVQSKNPDNEKLAQLREYVTQGMALSEISSVEYDLIDNAGAGFETMTKQTFDKYPLHKADGTEVALDSDEGIMFLVDKLSNPENGSTALQVFFAHTGLSEKAVDVISNSIKPAEVSDFCEQVMPEVKNVLGNINALKTDFEDFESEKSVSYSSYKDAVKHYVQTLDKEYANKTEEEKQVYNAYKAFLLKTQNADFAKTVKGNEIMPFLAKVHEMGIESLTSQGLDAAQSLVKFQTIIENRLSAIKALKLPENSEKENIRQQFVADAEAAYNKLNEAIVDFNELVS